MTKPQLPPQLLSSLQAGRAVACLAVVLHHAVLSTEAFLGPLPAAVHLAGSLGYLGVDFFFVLSGFIILHTNWQDRTRPGWTRRYVAARVTRIYAPYLPVGIGLAVLYVSFPTISAVSRAWDWLPTLTLLPVGATALSVAWTLQYEICFYFVFWCAAASKRPFVVLAGWLLLIIASLSGVTGGLPPQLGGALCLEFYVGMAAAYVVRSGKLSGRTGTIGFLLAGLVGLVAAVALFEQQTQRVLVAASLGCIIVPMVRLEMGRGFTMPRTVMLLGSASYAIYLVHDPVISATVRLAQKSQLSAGFGCLVLFIAATLCGIAYHLAVERPALRRLRGFSSLRRSESFSKDLR